MTKAKPRSKSLTDALAKVRKDRGLRIGSLSEVLEAVEGLSTGNLALDYVTGCWGLPRGRIVEMYGLQSSGKTTSSLQAAAVAQRAGENVVYLDYEYSLDPAYCQALGLDPFAESFIVAQPDTFEQGMNTLRELVQTGEVGIAIVDSVASMVTEKELDLETGSQSNFGEKARMMAQTMRQLAPILARHSTVCVFLNHVRDVIDTSPMGRRLSASGVERKTTPGGTALKFHASQRLHFKPIGKVRHEERDALTDADAKVAVGEKVQVVVEKNKVGVPFRRAELRLTYGSGFSRAWPVLQVLVAYGAITKGKSGMYTIHGDAIWEGHPQTIRGEDAVVKVITDTPEWLDHLEVLARKVLEEHAERFQAIGDTEDEEAPSESLGSSPDLDALLAE